MALWVPISTGGPMLSSASEAWPGVGCEAGHCPGGAVSAESLAVAQHSKAG